MFWPYWQSCPDEGQRARLAHVGCFQCYNGPLIKSFLMFVPEKTHNGLNLCSAFLGHSKCFTYWNHYSFAQCTQWCVSVCTGVMCDMIQVGSSVSRRTPTRRTRTAWLSKACWRPTSRACGPSSSTAPPTSLPSSTRWLGERRATHDTTAKSRCGLIWTNYPRDELESLSCINPATTKKISLFYLHVPLAHYWKPAALRH